MSVKSFLKMLFFIIVGIAGLIGGIALICLTISFGIVFIIGGSWIKAIGCFILWFIEIFVINWFLGSYHGE